MKPIINRKKQLLLSPIIVAINLFLLHNVAIAQEHSNKTASQKPDHIMVSPDNLIWSEGPGSIPPGAKFTVIEGDPSAPGLFTMRLWLPAGFKIAAHWHPADEHVTVISGTFLMGLGDTFETEKLNPLTTGSFAVMAAKTRHFAMAREETVVQLHGIGPWGINYVNPADDPRKKQ
jgi:hypothetical protein